MSQSPPNTPDEDEEKESEKESPTRGSKDEKQTSPEVVQEGSKTVDLNTSESSSSSSSSSSTAVSTGKSGKNMEVPKAMESRI
jgi:hypothetical protein